MKKSFLTILTALALAICLCACTHKETPASPPVSPTASQPVQAPEQTPASPTPESPDLPTESPTETPDASKSPAVTLTLESLRRQATGYSCAVAYVGYTESGRLEDLWDSGTLSGCVKEYGFIREIPAERQVELPGGDVYCIVPVDGAAELAVYPVEYDEEGLEKTGSAAYTGGGEPILLVCNVSDIMPNSLVSVQADMTELEFSPFISLKDGSLATTAPDGAIYDFS